MTAGTPTSTVPMTRPNPSDATATVRIPGSASAPNRPIGAAGTGRCVRTAWVSANAADPAPSASATAVPFRATAQHQQRGQRRPEDEEDLQADRLVAERGVAAAAGGTSRVHRVRLAAGIAGWASPTTTAQASNVIGGAGLDRHDQRDPGDREGAARDEQGTDRPIGR